MTNILFILFILAIVGALSMLGLYSLKGQREDAAKTPHRK